MKIVVVGLGYVGLSNAVLLAQCNEVIGVDISQQKVDCLNQRRPPIADPELTIYLAQKKLNLTASTNLCESVSGADYVIVSTPTDYDETTKEFDTSSVEAVIEEALSVEPKTCIIVKSTVPVGFVDRVRREFNNENIIFSPEFLREGKALYDNLYPSRIVIGSKTKKAENFAALLAKCSLVEPVKTIFTGTREAEAIKLFSNCYLAMRVAFFNELDSYAFAGKLNPMNIIEGVSHDPRIGLHYNNPSFGYGGYCLPKDTKQLLANYEHIPQKLIQAIVEANTTRQGYIAHKIIEMTPKKVGVYRLLMKAGSDNIRQSAILPIIRQIKSNNIDIIIYEPNILNGTFEGMRVENDLKLFKAEAEVILANRMDSTLTDVKNKVFTRDIYNEN